jgi:hypothetical protein
MIETSAVLIAQAILPLSTNAAIRRPSRLDLVLYRTTPVRDPGYVTTSALLNSSGKDRRASARPADVALLSPLPKFALYLIAVYRCAHSWLGLA